MASIVFKVKYEETLRRFNVAVNRGQRLDLSMEGLRRKICSLFNLPPEADFRLTYSDEDDDLVTLVEDEDLHDVVAQGLDPVRITVHLKSDKITGTGTDASGNSTPSPASAHNAQPNSSPNVAEVLKSVQEPLSQFLQKLGSSSQNLQQSTTPDVAEIVKAVQEPLTHALSKLSLEMSSKAASASPIHADLFDGLSKLVQSRLNASLSQSGAANLGSHDDVGNAPKLGSEGRSSEASVVEGTKNDVVSGLHPSQQVPKSTQATESGVPARPPLLFSSYDKGKNASCDTTSEKMSCNGDMKNKKCGIEGFAGKHGAGWTAFGHLEEKTKSSRDTSHNTRGSRFSGNTCTSYHEPILPVECPFSGIPVSGYGQKSQPDQIFKQFFQSNRNQVDGFGSIFHKGVRCDGCGVLPITGPRFKSKVKYDFDLCCNCFSRTENGADYTRIDFPLPYRHCWSSRISDPVTCLPVTSVPYMPRARGAKHHRTILTKLDSRFIMDVNVVDGTTMPPSTSFTKIWRMCNNGTLPWNRGLQLLWIGGDRFSPSDSVEIEVPVDGVQLGNELDIAVDFIAPELPGRYTSYWRMAEPSGHKFGQRVWVQIQVDASMDVTRESTPILNLNLPPDNLDLAADVTAELQSFLETGDACTAIFEENNKVELGDLTFPTNDDLLVPSAVVHPSSAASSPSAQSAPSLNSPTSPIGIYAPCPVVKVMPDNQPAPAVPVASVPFTSIIGELSRASLNAKDGTVNPEVDSHVKQASEKSEVEENLLNELKQMGFKQIDLNKEVLRMNQYDLERSVDELCGVSEWDPILEELKEMGFEDKETNKKLLAKNNGSITRVVMDLIAEEKA